MIQNAKIKVLITGAGGQLGLCIKKIAKNDQTLDYYFQSSQELDITNKNSIKSFFDQKKIDYVINCAAFTNVEQAEKESSNAFAINAEGTKKLAEICNENGSVLIHISTDYVFDGIKRTPYTEEDLPNPINEYGKSKLLGEKYIQQILKKYFIIRTSWLYSQFGNNFYKTILKIAETKNVLKITTSETGTPTNANDLAAFIIYLINNNKSKEYGIYHYSNEGEASWYDFAKEILINNNLQKKVKLQKTEFYKTLAKRPSYSVLNKERINLFFGMDISNWRISLSELSKNKIR